MTAIEMKYSLFKEIDSIEDESMLTQLAAFVRSLLGASKKEVAVEVDKQGLPEFIRNMSVRTGMTGSEDFEDALQYFSAKKCGAEAIITRNKKDFKASELPLYQPTEYLAL